MFEISRRNFIKISTKAVAATAILPNVLDNFFISDAYAIDKNDMIFDNLHHEGIYVKSTAETIKFYVKNFNAKYLFTADAMEGDKPLKLTFIRVNNVIIELLEPVDKSKIFDGAMNTLNHICFRTNDAKGMAKKFTKLGLNLEFPEPFNARINFDRNVTDTDIFTKFDKKGVDVRLFFIRGINGERIEIMQDDLTLKPSKTPKLSSIHHTGIYCVDMDETVRFYESVLGFKTIFLSEVMEGDKPLKMAFLKHENIVIELLSPVKTSSIISSAMNTQNHLCIRTTDIDKTYKYLQSKKVNLETGILSAKLKFSKELTDKSVFTKFDKKSVDLKLFFFRGINGERFEIMQDNI